MKRNTGPNSLYWTVGTSGVTATTSDSYLAPNSWDSFVVKAGQTTIGAIVKLATQSATIQAESGTGLPSGTGGPIVPSNNAVGQTIAQYSNTGGTDNGGLAVAVGATAAGTNSTKDAWAVQGITGGIPVPISLDRLRHHSPSSRLTEIIRLLSRFGATSTRTAIPLGGSTTIAVYNTGANAAFVALGNSSVVATASNDQVAPGGFLCLAVGANVDIAAIETAGATTLNVSGGAGGCAGSGGGGGSERRKRQRNNHLPSVHPRSPPPPLPLPTPAHPSPARL